jgi:GNAT superfamily N-acetyltransferase
MSDPHVVLSEQPTDVDRKAILDALMAYNEQAGGPSGFQPVAILINDPSTGATLGGLWGRVSYDWLFVELFVVPEQFRGKNLGSRILTQAEDYARQRGCIGVWLDTYAFQAPDFYKKLGYEVFGTIEDHPRGRRRFFVKKHL